MTPESRYDSLFQFYAQEHNIPDWRLLKAQVKAESNFNPTARSVDGALGLAQFMPLTFNDWARRLFIPNPNPYNPEHSIWCQAAYMRWLMDQFPHNGDKALAAYNFGVGRVHNIPSWLSSESGNRRLLCLG